jgi:hypothetical protein
MLSMLLDECRHRHRISTGFQAMTDMNCGRRQFVNQAPSDKSQNIGLKMPRRDRSNDPSTPAG